MSESWRLWAACEKADPEEAFVAASKAGAGTFIRKYCDVCPVVDECLDLAMRAESGMARHGIFGGLTASERANLARYGWRDCRSCGVRFAPRNAQRRRCYRCMRHASALSATLAARVAA